MSAKCSTHILNIVKNYYKNSKMIVQNKMKVYTRKMEKECPQDSIIGPRAWVWCMDVVLNDLREYVASMCAEFIAYADDLACVIKVNTRAYP